MLNILENVNFWWMVLGTVIAIGFVWAIRICFLLVTFLERANELMKYYKLKVRLEIGKKEVNYNRNLNTVYITGGVSHCRGGVFVVPKQTGR